VAVVFAYSFIIICGCLYFVRRYLGGGGGGGGGVGGGGGGGGGGDALHTLDVS
jgi:hypothetical protein